MNRTLKTYLIDTCRTAIESMRELHQKDPFKALYHMSAIYGALGRVFNIEYDRKLVFAHGVFQHTHQQMNTQFMKIATQAERAMDIRMDVMVSLLKASEEFVDRLEAGEDFTDELMRISEVMYSTTGNGHYLYLQEKLKLDLPEDVNNIEEAFTGDFDPIDMDDNPAE